MNAPKITSLLLVSSSLSQASTVIAQNLLSRFNAVTTENYTPTGADSEGSLLIGGSAIIDIAFDANSFGIPTEVGIYASSFQFGATGSVRLLNGDVVTPSSPPSGRFSFTSGGSLESGAAGATAYNQLFTDLGISSADLSSTLISASATWRDMPKTTDIVNPGQNLRFEATAGVNVYNIEAADVFTQNYNPQFSVTPGTEAILVNVSGTVIDNSTLGQNLNNIPEDIRRLLIWNFHEATDLDFSSIGGAIFAPQADVSILQSDGSVVAKNLTHDSELHLDRFEGSIPVPEPSTALLVLASLSFLARRKRS